MGDDLKNKILERHGIKIANKQTQIVSRICGRCNYVNKLESKYCERVGCNSPLTQLALDEIKAAEKVKLQELVTAKIQAKDREIHELKERMNEMATISSTNQAFAMTSPSLSLGAFPNGGKIGSAGTLRVSLSGKLTSEGSGIDGATIHITGTGEGKQFTVTTNEFGSYSIFVDLAPGTHEIQAYFPGDATHISASATRTITVTS